MAKYYIVTLDAEEREMLNPIPIAYENVGLGDAFEVFIVNSLEPQFDASTLMLPGNASFSPGSRSIFWRVGDLAPHGEPGSSRLVSFTVRLKGDLPSGTLVSNQSVRGAGHRARGERAESA